VCFSAQADLVAGIVVTGVGIDTIRHVGHDREALLAGLPILFGIHQLMEVPVWMGADGSVSEGVAHSFSILYLIVAFGIVPWIVPLAVRRLEPDLTRRRFMSAMVWVGAAVSTVLVIPTLSNPVSAVDAGTHVSYVTDLVLGGPVTVLYVMATCGSLLASSDRAVVWYGVVNLVVVSVLAGLLTSGVISLWCVWAAVTSIAIAVHLRRIHRIHELTHRLVT
jgi:hypothetical protein